MADGYARVTGRVGVCSVTQGPGVTNTLTALTEARKAGSPLLLLAGDSPMRFVRHNQDVDQTAIFNSVGVAVERVRAPDTVIADVARGFNRAWASQRPVAMQFPTDMQDLPCDATAPPTVCAQRPPASRPPPDAIKLAADLVAAAKRPAIIAGRGAVRANAKQSLEIWRSGSARYSRPAPRPKVCLPAILLPRQLRRLRFGARRKVFARSGFDFGVRREPQSLDDAQPRAVRLVRADHSLRRGALGDRRADCRGPWFGRRRGGQRRSAERGIIPPRNHRDRLSHDGGSRRDQRISSRRFRGSKQRPHHRSAHAHDQARLHVAARAHGGAR